MYDTTYDPTVTTTVDPATSGAVAVFMGMMGVFWLFFMALLVVLIIAQWKIFTKAGKPGWASIVPVYNFIILLQIVNRPVWWIAFLVAGMIPFVNFLALPVMFVVSIILAIDLAKAFGKSTGFGVFMAFFPYIGYPMLAFGSAEYQGSTVVAPVAAAPVAPAPPVTPVAPTEPTVPTDQNPTA